MAVFRNLDEYFMRPPLHGDTARVVVVVTINNAGRQITKKASGFMLQWTIQGALTL